MNFSAKYGYPFCDKLNDFETSHDYFIQYNSLREEKKDWLEKLREDLVKKFIPTNLGNEIFDRV